VWFPQKFRQQAKTKNPFKFVVMTRRKFTSKFKAKVALEALRESQGLNQPAMKFELPPPKSVNGSKNGEPALNRSFTGLKLLASAKQHPTVIGY
jgi:hypothetical protein